MHEQVEVEGQPCTYAVPVTTSPGRRQRYLFIAGGIGITPILPMINEAEACGAHWRLLYGGRSAESMAFASELARSGDKVTLWPQDRRGCLTSMLMSWRSRSLARRVLLRSRTLLTAVEQRCQQWERGALHIERFRKAGG